MPHTDEVTVTLKGLGNRPKTFVLSAGLGKQVADYIADSVKRIEKKGSVPAVKVLPELADDTLRPATMLRGARHKADIIQVQLAEALGIRQHHLSEMENGKRPLGKQMAKRLAEVLDCDYRLFM